MARIIIAKKDKLLRECLDKVLVLHGYKVLCTCETGKELIKAAILQKPDLVISGYSFEDIDCLNAFSEIRKSESYIRFVIYIKDRLIVKPEAINLKNKAHGIINSSCGLIDLLECIKCVLAGGSYFGNTRNSIQHHEILDVKLSKRELEILKMISGFRTATQIAEELHISMVTVNNHKANIVRKLKLRGRNALLEFALGGL